MYTSSRIDGHLAGEASARHAAHYARTLGQVYALFVQGGNSTQAGLRQFDRERPNIEVGQRWAAARWEADDRAARLCCAYANSDYTFLELRLGYEDRILWREIGLRAARRLGDQRSEMVCRLGLGAELAFIRDMAGAFGHLEVALRIAGEIVIAPLGGSPSG